MRDTSTAGQIGELAVMERLARTGWHVLISYGNSTPYDLVGEKADRFIRVQVRTTQAKNGYISVNCRAKNNRVRTRPGSFDFLIAYELNSDSAFVIPEDEFTGKAVFHIRLSPARSGQVRGIHPAEEYRERWDRLDIGA